MLLYTQKLTEVNRKDVLLLLIKKWPNCNMLGIVPRRVILVHGILTKIVFISILIGIRGHELQ
jgi:hypothetical protein